MQRQTGDLPSEIERCGQDGALGEGEALAHGRCEPFVELLLEVHLIERRSIQHDGCKVVADGAGDAFERLIAPAWDGVGLAPADAPVGRFHAHENVAATLSRRPHLAAADHKCVLEFDAGGEDVDLLDDRALSGA